MSLAVFLISAALVLAGLAFGMTYFAVLRHSVDQYSGGGGGGLAALAVGRIAAAAAFFGLAATLGALPLLCALLGFLFARMLALRAAAWRLPP
jgi:N-ATPase, AtpR subunit